MCLINNVITIIIENTAPWKICLLNIRERLQLNSWKHDISTNVLLKRKRQIIEIRYASLLMRSNYLMFQK